MNDKPPATRLLISFKQKETGNVPIQHYRPEMEPRPVFGKIVRGCPLKDTLFPLG